MKKEGNTRSESPVKREVMIRHLNNLAQLHGVFYHGVYYHLGVPQPHSKASTKTVGTNKVSIPVSR